VKLGFSRKKNKVQYIERCAAKRMLGRLSGETAGSDTQSKITV
jgi:hypothetical protein